MGDRRMKSERVLGFALSIGMLVLFVNEYYRSDTFNILSICNIFMAGMIFGVMIRGPKK